MPRDCKYCGNWSCMRDTNWRPSSHKRGGTEVQTCGRYMRAGELAATWVTANAMGTGVTRFGICIGCLDHAVLGGLSESNYMVAQLQNCLPCGYSSAQVPDEVKVRG